MYVKVFHLLKESIKIVYMYVIVNEQEKACGSEDEIVWSLSNRTIKKVKLPFQNKNKVTKEQIG